jgi:hypothetical protein
MIRAIRSLATNACSDQAAEHARIFQLAAMKIAARCGTATGVQGGGEPAEVNSPPQPEPHVPLARLRRCACPSEVALWAALAGSGPGSEFPKIVGLTQRCQRLKPSRPARTLPLLSDERAPVSRPWGGAGLPPLVLRG